MFHAVGTAVTCKPVLPLLAEYNSATSPLCDPNKESETGFANCRAWGTWWLDILTQTLILMVNRISLRGSKDLSLIHSLNTLLLVSCVVFRGGFSCCRAAVWQQRQQSLIVVFHCAHNSFCWGFPLLLSFWDPALAFSFELRASSFWVYSGFTRFWCWLGWVLLSGFSALRLGVSLSAC